MDCMRISLSSVTMSVGTQEVRYLYHDLEDVTLEPVILSNRYFAATREEYRSNWILMVRFSVLPGIQYIGDCKLVKFTTSISNFQYRTLYNQYLYYDMSIDRCYLIGLL